jgi:hypothetical protein
MKDKPFELKSHSSQIADTGDYDGYYEITNGKVSIMTRDDQEDNELQEVADALNKTRCSFYLDDSHEFLYHVTKQEFDSYKSVLKGVNPEVVPELLRTLKNLCEYFEWAIDDPNFPAYREAKEAINKAKL